MENRNNKKKKGGAYAVTLTVVSLMLIFGALIAGEAINDGGDKNDLSGQLSELNGDIDFGSLVIDGSTDKPEDGAQEQTSQTEKPEKSESAVLQSAQSDKNDAQTVSAAMGIDFAKITWPVASKEIVMDYSYNTSPVYSVTMREYRSDHEGTDIKATVGEDVKCIYGGRVKEVRNDARLGVTVTVDHGNTMMSIYANLDEDVKVSVNDKIKAGTVIGKVGATAAYESAEEAHLHFGLKVNGSPADPKKYMKF